MGGSLWRGLWVSGSREVLVYPSGLQPADLGPVRASCLPVPHPPGGLSRIVHYSPVRAGSRVGLRGQHLSPQTGQESGSPIRQVLGEGCPAWSEEAQCRQRAW